MTTDVTIALANPEDLSAIAELVVEMGGDPGTHCIHSWAGESVIEVARELRSTFDDGELKYVLARRGNALVGAMGCEFDVELGRGWLHGPHVRGDRDAIGRRLFDALLAGLPSGIAELDAFLNEANEAGRRFYMNHGFRERDTRFHEYQMHLDIHSIIPDDQVAIQGGAGDATEPAPLTQTHHPSFFSLFDGLFPSAYYDHDRLLEMQDDSHQILVLTEGSLVEGFAVPYRAPGGHRGEIQFLGVREERRGEGLGRRLLRAGIDWLRHSGVNEISLNVEDTKAGARRLYGSVGFGLRYTGVALKSTLPPTPYPELNAILQDMVDSIRAILGDTFAAACLQGSFAVGDFDRHSDVDFVIVVEEELSDQQVGALQILHERLYHLDNPWAQHLEGSYFPKAVLKDHTKCDTPLWYLEHGSDSLIRSDHCNTVVVRWTVREHGVGLFGSDPASLVDPIPVETLRGEIRAVIRDWGHEILAEPDRFNNRFYQSFIVLSYCRVLRDLEVGDTGSKRAGAEWAKGALDPSWAGLIDRAWGGRPNPSLSIRQQAEPEDFRLTLEFIPYCIGTSLRLTDT